MNRETFLNLLGSLPVKSGLNFQIIDEEDLGSYIRKKISFSSEPNEIITAFLCVPKRQSPLPAIYCFHQHGGNHILGKSELVGLAGSADQAYAKELAEIGFITLAPDAICFEERANTINPYPFHAHQLSSRLMRGQTLLGKVLFDISAGIDLLETLPEVDSNRIGFIGHSYGGRAALFAPVYDRRIKASVCSCGSTLFNDMISKDIGIQFDFVVPNFLNYGDIDDIVKLHDPSSLLIIGTDDDRWSLSIDSIFNKTKSHFLKGTLEAEIFPGKHQFSPEMKERAYSFLQKFL